MGEEKEITFVCKPIESTVKETIEMDYKKEYEKILSRYHKLLDENKKLNKALVNLALKVK